MTSSITNQQNIDNWESYDTKEIENFGDEGDLTRQIILTPTILSLLRNITNLKILDAGSGTGYLSRKLAKLGAKVTAIEPVKSTFNYSIKREDKEKLGILYLNKDLSNFSIANSFDFVISNMVLQDIPDFEKAITNCILSLKLKGKFIFSILHPAFEATTSDYLKDEGVLVTEYQQKYSKKQKFGYAFHRTITNYFEAVTHAGGNIVNIIEPGITKKQEEQYPELKKEAHIPSFIFFVAERQ